MADELENALSAMTGKDEADMDPRKVETSLKETDDASSVKTEDDEGKKSKWTAFMDILASCPT